VENQLSISEILGALKRRKKPALLAFSVVLTASLLYAVLVSPVYRSSSTILIEQQEIPQDLVRTTVTSYADQRIQMILQRVMTFAKLSELIKKYELYPDERKKEPLESIVEMMREDIGQKMISAEVVDPRSGRPMEATIAFSLSYKSESAKTAQQVANELTTLFLSENIKNRKEMANEAEDFLSVEVSRLEQKSRALESTLAKFKEENLKLLPEMTSVNMNIMDRSERELFDVNRQIQSLEERRIYLQSQLSQISPRASVMAGDAEQVLSPQARAKLLQNRLISLSVTYTDNHPDIGNARRELDEIIDDGYLPSDALFLRKQIEIYHADLYGTERSTELSEDKKNLLLERIASLEEKLSGVGQGGQIKLSEADNPAYIQMATSLEAAVSELRHFKKSRTELKRKISDLEQALAGTPDVERMYRNLARDYDNTSMKYRELKEKQLQASLAKTLEDERKGERFTLIEPPLMPEKPLKPNRILLFVIGILVSLAAAFGMIFINEKMDGTFYSERVLRVGSGMSPLAVIPHIHTSQELRLQKQKSIAMLCGVAIFLTSFIVTVHVALMPLDVLWFTVLRKI
jgi:uncharacterized protein involved in exopolysaccharide biosynthesis